MPTHSSYNEGLLHWIWKNRQLGLRPLTTTSNKKVEIYHPGYANETDGPDFLNARIAIGPLTFHGDVEIHWTARDWKGHCHHNDPNYNRVVLHAVFNDGNITEVFRYDQTSIPTLCLKPHLRDSLKHFAESYRRQTSLPCAGNLNSVPNNVFKTQIAKAQKEYFEQKVDQLLQLYDPNLTLSRAWQNLCITGLFDALGIIHNREPMKKLASRLLTSADAKNRADLIHAAWRLAGIDPENTSVPYSWKRKGSRPNNHPRHRIAQGCELLWIIQKKPVLHWLRTDIAKSFDQCRKQMDYKPGLGRGRADVLCATVWLPAVYILADILGKQQYTEMAYDAWFNHRMKLPSSITKPFEEAGIPPSIYKTNLGTVFQRKAYCNPGRCEHCSIFKSIISS